MVIIVAGSETSYKGYGIGESKYYLYQIEKKKEGKSSAF